MLTVVGIGLLSSCGPSVPTDGWFPLEAGRVWTYRVTTRSGDDTSEREALVLRTLGRETLEMLDREAVWHRRSDTGLDYWLRSDASGIYRVAAKTDVQAEPVLDKPVRYVLKAPIAVGTQWQADTAPYLLMRRSEFPREIRHTHPKVAMTYTIEATDDTVQVPAGAFKPCLRVKGQGAVRVYADPASGWRDMPLVTTEWYCRGVGLAKLLREEPAQSAFLVGGSRLLELEQLR